MNQIHNQPCLSPQFCFSSGALQGFLRFSRSAIDDSISQNINGLVKPARAGFDPTSTAQRIPNPSSRDIPTRTCRSFQSRVLFPAWQVRTEILNYCGLVAASPDPNDPETTLRDIELQKDRERIIDERLDPYSARFYPRETRTQVLANLVRQERAIEDIVRHRTWNVVRERCAASDSTWQEAMESCRTDVQATTSHSVT